MAQAMLRSLATPKIKPLLPSKIPISCSPTNTRSQSSEVRIQNSESRMPDESLQFSFYFCLFTFSLVLIPFSQRYSFSPDRDAIQRASTKKRSLSRLTYLIAQGLTGSTRDRRRISRSARRQTVRHWCRYAAILPPPGRIKEGKGCSSFWH